MSDSKIMVGHRYAVDIDDCCVKGHFTARLVKIEERPSQYNIYHFDNGVIMTQIGGGSEIYEVSEETTTKAS